MRRPDRHGLALTIALSVLAIVWLLPIVWVVVTSVKVTADIVKLPPEWIPWPMTADHYFEVLFSSSRTARIGRAFLNSIVVALGTVAVVVVTSAMTAYPLARMRFPGRLPFIGLNVVLMVVPPVVLVVPLFLFFVNLGLVNSRFAVVIIYVGLLIPFSIYLLVNFFATIPRSLEEAARIDGAGQLRTLWSVIVPLSAPAIVTIVVVNAVWVWNELLIALVFLQDDQARTLTAGLTFFQGRFIQNEPLVMTGALIATIPMLLLYIVGQRFFIRGLTAGFGK
jgi:ABC-type glycerol-3-phosphate transport system permease component